MHNNRAGESKIKIEGEILGYKRGERSEKKQKTEREGWSRTFLTMVIQLMFYTTCFLGKVGYEEERES